MTVVQGKGVAAQPKRSRCGSHHAGGELCLEHDGEERLENHTLPRRAPAQGLAQRRGLGSGGGSGGGGPGGNGGCIAPLCVLLRLLPVEGLEGPANAARPPQKVPQEF